MNINQIEFQTNGSAVFLDGADFAFPCRLVQFRLIDDFEGPILTERRFDKPNFTIPAMAAALDGGDIGLFQPFGYFWRYGHEGELLTKY